MKSSDSAGTDLPSTKPEPSIFQEDPKLQRQAEEQLPPGCCWVVQHESKPMRRFVWGLDYIDEQVAQIRWAGDIDLPLQDANYNVVGRVGIEGSWVGYPWTQYVYSPYGEIIAAENGSGASSFDVDTQTDLYTDYQLFAGAWYDRETGLYHMRARYYSPKHQRFISQDPNGQALVLASALARNAQSLMAFSSLSTGAQYGNGMSLYAYASGNPIAYSDPTGLFTNPFEDPFFDDFRDSFEEVESVIAGLWADRQAAQIEALERAMILRDIALGHMKAIAKRMIFEGVATAVFSAAPYYFAAYDTGYALGALYQEGLSWEGAAGVAAAFYQVKVTKASGVGLSLKPRKGLLQQHLRLRQMRYRGDAGGKVVKVKGPEFPNLKAHARKHSDLHPSAYYNQAVRHTQTGKAFKFHHEGQMKVAYVTRLGADRFMFTSTVRGGRMILTHYVCSGQTIRNMGIVLPRGF